MLQPPASGMEPECAGDMSKQLREGLRLARVGRGQRGWTERSRRGLARLRARRGACSGRRQSFGINHLPVRTRVSSTQSQPRILLDWLPSFLSHVQECQLLVCSAAKSAESWWLKENFQHAHAACKRRDICTRNDILVKLKTEAPRRGLDECFLAKFVHAQAKHGGFYFPVLYRCGPKSRDRNIQPT